MIVNSIRWRLQLWHGLLLLVVLTGFGAMAWTVASNNVWNQVEAELDETMAAVFRPPMNGTRPPPPPPPGGFGPSPEGLHAMLGNLARNFASQGNAKQAYLVVWRGDGTRIASSERAPADIAMPARVSGNRMSAMRRTRSSYMELYRVMPFGDTVLVGQSVAPELAALRTTRVSLIAAGLTIWLLGLAGGWWLTTRALRTVEVISETAEKIAAGDLSHRVEVANTDSELDRLATVLNSMFARLELAFQQQAQFTADASHELRTPISVVLAQTQSALARERPASEYREALEACARAAQRMRKLVESLLQLARLDADQERSTRHPVELARIAEECVEFLRPMAETRGIRLVADLQSAPCRADSEQIAQVATNLLMNAVQFNRESGEVRISTGIQDGKARLVVADTGGGIPEKDLPLIFDRFYRVDKSRSGVSGRSGLGLAICKSIVEAHGGTIRASSVFGAGSTFTVELPIARLEDSRPVKGKNRLKSSPIPL